MKLKLYISALRGPDQAFDKLSRRNGRIDVLDHLPVRREQVKVGSVSDFHPMESPSALLPEPDRRTGRVRPGFRSGDGFDLRRGNAAAEAGGDCRTSWT
jgi:hypothetical protein